MLCHVTLLLTPPRSRTHGPGLLVRGGVRAYRGIYRKRMHTRAGGQAGRHTHRRASTAPPRIPDVTTLAHLARRTLEMSPLPLRPPPSRSFSSSSSSSLPRFLPPLPVAVPRPSAAPLTSPPPRSVAARTLLGTRESLLPAWPRRAHCLPSLTGRYLPSQLWRRPLAALATLSCVASRSLCSRRARRPTRATGHSPTRIFARVCRPVSSRIAPLSARFAMPLVRRRVTRSHDTATLSISRARARESERAGWRACSRTRPECLCVCVCVCTRARPLYDGMPPRGVCPTDNEPPRERETAEGKPTDEERKQHGLAAILTAPYANPGHPVCSTRGQSAVAVVVVVAALSP